MLPIGPLMMEHRLIEKMIALIRNSISKAEKEKNINLKFIDLAVDFIQTYADRCHHGKEENILFRELRQKTLSPEHARLMEELVEDHRSGRKAVREIVEAKEILRNGDTSSLSRLFDRLKFLSDFYPRHIEKEDKHFFIPCMDYFSKEEREKILDEGWQFDKNFIHELYKNKIETARKEFIFSESPGKSPSR